MLLAGATSKNTPDAIRKINSPARADVYCSKYTHTNIQAIQPNQAIAFQTVDSAKMTRAPGSAMMIPAKSRFATDFTCMVRLQAKGRAAYPFRRSQLRLTFQHSRRAAPQDTFGALNGARL